MKTKAENDIFYTATVLEQTARTTGNTRAHIAEKVGIEGMRNIYRMADVNHCLPLNQVAEEIISTHNIQQGNFHPEKHIVQVPKATAIGKVYARLVKDTQADASKYPESLFDIMKSKVSEWMTDYRSAYYYSTRDYILQSYQNLKK